MTDGVAGCLRDIHGEQVVFAWPVMSFDDRDILLVEHVAGSVGQVPDGYPESTGHVVADPALPRAHVAREWRFTNTLFVSEPGKWWSTRLMWKADTHEFLCWYVDFRVPIVRNGLFLDTRDLQLDIVVSPDGSWQMKDEDHYALGLSSGYISEAERVAVEESQSSAIAAIEGSGFPFDGAYRDWEFSGVVPTMPDDWSRV